MSSQERAPALPIIVLSVLYLIALVIPISSSSSLWGISLLGYCELTVRLQILAAALIAAVMTIVFGPKLKISDRIRSITIYVLIPMALVVIFSLLRVRAHYLGDGLLRIQEIERGLWWLPTEPLAQAVNYVVYKFLSLFSEVDSSTAVETVSYLGGLAYYFALLRFVRTVFRDGPTRLLIFITLYFSGMTVLFCGYAETYMLLPALMALFFTAGIKAVRPSSSPLIAYLLFLLLVLFHFKSVMLLPCIVLLTYYAIKDRLISHALIGACTIAISILAVMILPTLSPLPTLSATEFMLPLTSNETSYTFLSTQHVLDIFNELLLVAPAGLILILASLAVKKSGHFWGNRSLMFVAAALPGALAMLFLLHSRLGYAVDWDLYSSAALIISFFAAMIFSDFKELRICRISATALAAVCFTSFLAYSSVNADEDLAIKRQADVLSLYGSEGAIGFESMGNHLNNIGKADLAEQMWKKSLYLRPHVRLYANLAQLSLNQGRLMDAKYYAERGIDLDSTKGILWNHLGVTYTRAGEFNLADACFQTSLQYSPNESNFRHNYAVLLSQMNRFEEAEIQLLQALKYRPNDLKILIELFSVLRNEKKLLAAESTIRQAIALAPNFAELHLDLAQTVALRGDTLGSRQILLQLQRKYPGTDVSSEASRLLKELE